MKKKTTIHDIAAALGLTGSTVSRALNDHPRISAATKQLVREKARELNYRPNHLASHLRRGKSGSIGVLVPRISRQFFANVVSGIEGVTFEAGYNLLICQSIESLGREEKSVETLQNSQVEGLIVSLSAETHRYDHLLRMTEAGIPVVQFDRVTERIPGAQVINQDQLGARDMVAHLLQQGYRRIVHFGGPRHLNIYQNRYEGYRRALAEAGLPPEAYFDVLTQADGQQLTKHLLAQSEPPDAIFSASDFPALGALQVLQEQGIAVPDQVGVAGYANEPFTALVTPPLSSVEQHGERMGTLAAQMLLTALLEGRVGEEKSPIEVLPEVLIRRSSLRHPR